MTVSWKKDVYELTVREGHLDSFGHVNNAVYLQICEEARWEMITSAGYGYERVQESKIGPTILEAQLRFRRELRLRQRIIVETQVLSYAGKVGELQQEIKDMDGNVCCSVVLKMGLFDLTKRKLIPPTPEWLKAIGHEVALTSR